MLRNNADARRCSHFELGLPVTPKIPMMNSLFESWTVGRGSTIGVRKSRFPAFFSYQSRHPALLYARIPIPSHFLRGFLLNYWNRRCKYKTYLLTIVSFDGHFFVRASVHVYFDNFRSPVFLELGRLMSHYDSTALLLVSGDEANSLNC